MERWHDRTPRPRRNRSTEPIRRREAPRRHVVADRAARRRQSRVGCVCPTGPRPARAVRSVCVVVAVEAFRARRARFCGRGVTRTGGGCAVSAVDWTLAALCLVALVMYVFALRLFWRIVQRSRGE